MEDFKCDRCLKIFVSKYNLTRHQLHSKKQCSKKEPVIKTINQLKCKYCHHEFKQKSNLYRHQKHYCNNLPKRIIAGYQNQKARLEKQKLALVPTKTTNATTATPIVQNYTVNDYKTIQYITNNIIMVGNTEINKEELPQLAPTIQNLKHLQSKFPAIQNPIGFEDISHKTDEMTAEILKDEPAVAFEKIIKLVNDMPGNQNVGYYDKDHKKLMFVHQNGLELNKHDHDRHIGFICANITRIYDILLKKMKSKMLIRHYKKHYEFACNSDDDAEQEMEKIYRNYLLAKGFANYNILDVHETIIKNLQAIIKYHDDNPYITDIKNTEQELVKDNTGVNASD